MCSFHLPLLRASIRNSLVEIKKVNLKEKKKSHYINQDEWESWLEDEIELAIADASVEVLNGSLKRSQLSQMLDKPQLISTATALLTLTYTYSIRELPDIIDDLLAQLSGGEDWIHS